MRLKVGTDMFNWIIDKSKSQDGKIKALEGKVERLSFEIDILLAHMANKSKPTSNKDVADKKYHDDVKFRGDLKINCQHLKTISMHGGIARGHCGKIKHTGADYWVERGMPPAEYMIGQRVIYRGIICVVCSPDRKAAIFDATNPWIDNPERGYKHQVSVDNLKPLPNGQL